MSKSAAWQKHMGTRERIPSRTSQHRGEALQTDIVHDLGFRRRCAAALRVGLAAVIAGLASVSSVAESPASRQMASMTLPEPNVSVDQGVAFTLGQLEEMALANNPTLVQASAKIAASQGEALQAGLFPNPILGYTSEQIGIEGTAGELQGAFFEQEIVTGGKLRLSRQKYLQRVAQADLIALGQQYKVLNGVRIHYYMVLGAQRKLELEALMQENADDFELTAKEMANMGQMTKPEVLESTILARRQKIAIKKAENEYRACWQALASLLGVCDLPITPVAGKLQGDYPSLREDEALGHILANSPEILVAHAEVRHDQIAVRRERVQPIPNIFLSGNSGYNYETNNTVGGVQVGINLPVFDRNQGTIQQARADLSRSFAEVKRIELEIRRRLADAFARYDTALASVIDYEETTLPLAKEAVELSTQSYHIKRSPWIDVLRLKRSYTDMELAYTDSLVELRRAEVEIQGMLLIDGLVEPRSPTPGGHMDATPKPR